MVTLQGWLHPLPDDVVRAIEAGRVKVITIQDKKLGTYDLLQGCFQRKHMTICFK